MKKKIGFVDLYISEWHANNYPAWIKDAAKKLSLSYDVAYAYAEQDDSPFDGRNTAQWCRDFSAEQCKTIDELCEKSDVIIILAPSNPEVHLHLAEAVLKHKKPTYIDKTFAPDYKTAREIYAIGEKYDTPFFSSSALRYAAELEGLSGAKDVFLTGGGSNFPEYSIHMIEMLVKTLGTGAVSTRAEKIGSQTHVFVSYADGRAASMTYAPALPFTIYAKGDAIEAYRPIASEFFPALIEDILRFFESEALPFPKEETLEAMKVREGALLAAENPGKTILLADLA